MNPFNPLSFSSITEQQLENLLRSLPKFRRSNQADEIFFKRLNALIQKQQEESVKRSHINSWFAWPKLVFATTSTIILILVTGTFTVYRPSVTRGHFLYPWKQVSERVELAFAFSPLQKVDAHVRFSLRRLEEIKFLTKDTGKTIALFLTIAYAHAGEIHLTPEQGRALIQTLGDMRAEVKNASVIITNNHFLPRDAESALKKIEAVTEKEIKELKKVKKELTKEIQEIVEKITEESQAFIAVIVEAQEDVEEAIARNEEKVEIAFNEEAVEAITALKEKTAEEIENIQEFLDELSVVQQTIVEEKFTMMEDAVNSGNFGKALGLANILKHQIGMIIEETEEEKEIIESIQENDDDYEEEEEEEEEEEKEDMEKEIKAALPDKSRNLKEKSPKE